jgi:hypothetical protein
MPNEVLTKDGTAVTWQASGGTYAMTLTSLASGSARVGAAYDRGATRSRRVRVELRTRFGTAPTDATTVDVYLATSRDGTTYTGNITPGDAALTSTDTLRNLLYIGGLVADNLTTAQSQAWEVELGARYVVPVVHNNATGQTLSGTATDHILAITPLVDEVQ